MASPDDRTARLRRLHESFGQLLAMSLEEFTEQLGECEADLVAWERLVQVWEQYRAQQPGYLGQARQERLAGLLLAWHLGGTLLSSSILKGDRHQLRQVYLASQELRKENDA